MVEKFWIIWSSKDVLNVVFSGVQILAAANRQALAVALASNLQVISISISTSICFLRKCRLLIIILQFHWIFSTSVPSHLSLVTSPMKDLWMLAPVNYFVIESNLESKKKLQFLPTSRYLDQTYLSLQVCYLITSFCIPRLWCDVILWNGDFIISEEA